MISRLLNDAFVAFDEDRLDDAERLYREAIALIEGRDSDEYRNALHMLAFVKSHQKHFDEARAIYRQLRYYSARRGDKTAEAIALHQLGMVERLAGEFDAAIFLFEEEFALRSKHSSEDYMGFSANIYEQGYVTFLRGDLDEAHKILFEALRFGEAARDHACIACALRGLGEVEAARRNVAKARQYFLKSKREFRRAGDERGALEIEPLVAQLGRLPPL